MEGEWSDIKALKEIPPEKELLPWGPFASCDEGAVEWRQPKGSARTSFAVIAKAMLESYCDCKSGDPNFQSSQALGKRTQIKYHDAISS